MELFHRVEGAARNSEKEFVQFLHVALGSAAEVETQLIIAQRLNYMAADHGIVDRLTSVMKMLNGLIRYYKKKSGISNQGSGTRKEKGD